MGKKKNGYNITEEKQPAGGKQQLVGTKVIKPKTVNQNKYVEYMNTADVTFGIGPGGSGKTLLAVNYAVNQLFLRQYSKLIISRPVVEAGENLGFLPGDVADKIDPFIRPIMDSLRDILGSELGLKNFLFKYVEIAPLAFMRGRTLNDSIIILDEAQNTSEEQMYMFLTRIGNNSKAIITADPTQIDLKQKKDSGIFEALTALKDIEGIQVVHFTHEDVLRCPVVRKIVSAYTKHRNEMYKKERTVQEVFEQ